MNPLRSNRSTQGRRMAGARALWRANGMKETQFGKPIIAVVNSFTQFVPGHVHLHGTGQFIKKIIEDHGCYAAEFNTIAIDDGIAMGHEGMLYSLPSRELIADSIEYMCNAHCVDAMICISNCDKITPGMLMAAMRLNIPSVFISGGPMEAGEGKTDLVDVMVMSADSEVSESTLRHAEQVACPTCGSCAGMFTANSMNCLTEALGLSPVGSGTVLATHKCRMELVERAARLIVKITTDYYDNGNSTVLPRSILSKSSLINALSMDIAMGGSTNTVLHLLAIAYEAGLDFRMDEIDRLSRQVPVLCKVSPNGRFHIEDVNRAGGVMRILGELSRGGFIDGSVSRVDYNCLDQALEMNDIRSERCTPEAMRLWLSAPGGKFGKEIGGQEQYFDTADVDPVSGCVRNVANSYSKDGGLAVLYGNLAPDGSIVKSAGVDTSMLTFKGRAVVFESQEEAIDGILNGKVAGGDVVVIRYEGPAGGPGMQEMLYPTSYLKSMKLDRSCALITDGRFSGGSSGLSVGHISPEAAAGGNIALVKDGDMIFIDIPQRVLMVELSDEELEQRRASVLSAGDGKFRPLNRDREVSNSLKIYSSCVSSADRGAVRIIR